MAQIINKSNHLRKDIFIEYIKLIVCGFSALMCLGLAIYTYGLSIIGTLILGFYIKQTKTQINILKFGLEGERKALKLLENLPKRYKVLSDLLIQDRKKSSQIDYIVVGSNGIFIVEVKNLKGTIVGDIKDKQLTLQKTGRAGGQYSKQFYNPVYQVEGHVKGLSKLLEKNKCLCQVQGIVYFTNEACKVNVKSTATPMFDESNDDLLKYIKTYKKDNVKLTPKEQIKIVDLLRGYIM